jgi:hypothetical protein
VSNFYYVRPDESFYGGTASGGTIATDFNRNWLVDGRPGRPAKATTTGMAWTVLPAASVANCGLVAVCNHNLDAAIVIAVTGGLAGNITVPTHPADGIPLNPFTLFTPATVSTLTLTASGNSVAVVVGEIYAGRYRTLERQIRLESSHAPIDPLEWEGEFGSVPPYDAGIAARTLRGTTYVTAAGLADIQAWYESTRRGTRPTLIVPDSLTNDAWLVTFSYRYAPIKAPDGSTHLYRVELEFVEVPRTRW